MPLDAYINPVFYLYLAGVYAKQGIRDYNLSKIRADVGSGILSIPSAIIEILDSSIGQTDTKSFKFLFLQKLTGLSLDNTEANEMISVALNYLKNRNSESKISGISTTLTTNSHFKVKKVDPNAYTKEVNEVTCNFYNEL